MSQILSTDIAILVRNDQWSCGPIESARSRKEFDVNLLRPSHVIPTVTVGSELQFSGCWWLGLQDSLLLRIDDENALASLSINTTGDSLNQRIIEINYIPSSSPNFEPYRQIAGFECSPHTSSLKTLNFSVEVERDFAKEYGRPTLFPSSLLWRVEDRKLTHASISYSPEQPLSPYPDQENFYRRRPWIDVFASDAELPISDVWDSYLPSGSRYGRRQDVNGGATAVYGYGTSLTVTSAKKIWDDPAYYYIVLEETFEQPGATGETNR
ncbi:hypothetical protein K435DRAFT_804001 [Dendrothele bispora CBS 962.96]|uniref:Uncharacterized protein n=1 Tax=Dendrothele bispora (strain CBS 962.96) TaxID=1314807 RepID=A0A4S8LG23_DENBC|nr:hypothetical protein K435DRAFT_804001 [Dendrothele bispora CBS 962.96]